jgi:hypothetical protein
LMGVVFFFFFFFLLIFVLILLLLFFSFPLGYNLPIKILIFLGQSTVDLKWVVPKANFVQRNLGLMGFVE